MSLSRRRFLELACPLAGGAAAGWLLLRRFRGSGGAIASDPRSGGVPRLPRLEASKRAMMDGSVTEAMHYEELSGGRVRCKLCFRECIIGEGGRGFCENRENRQGKLYTLVFNRPCALQIDPIEKEPLYHFLPATTIFCVSTASCNYRCRFCQNWHLSYSGPEDVSAYDLTAADIVQYAKRNGCPTISHTYAEPTVHYEYLLAVAREARKEGLRFIYHTNLGIRPEPLEEILPLVSALSIDLKGFHQDYYGRMCNANLATVLENLKIVRRSGTHFELVNLVLPTQNDDPGQVEEMCTWIRDNLGADTPLHFSRFHPTHRFRELPATPIKTLERCCDIAQEAGLSFVSIGNVPGHRANSTYCPDCGKRLIHREHFAVLENRVKEGSCPDCGRKLPGVWS
ncbi:MAG: AmmeMemoRadiSam system radical SAM enzyme [Candidatus Brocadiae bacterium]|nr:AmmeMemoRadiSam system radical SAM enzyme [Candidatus Brocadiia bacterium]